MRPLSLGMKAYLVLQVAWWAMILLALCSADMWRRHGMAGAIGGSIFLAMPSIAAELARRGLRRLLSA